MAGNGGKLMILSTGFLLLFCVFMTAQNLASQVLDDLGFGNLGFYSLAVLYFIFAFSCFIATPIVNKCGERFSMTVGSMCYTFYTASFILASLPGQYPEDASNWYASKDFIGFTNLFGAACNGFGAAILWVAQGRYISRIANDSNKGTYNSIFRAFMQVSGIFGALFSALVLKNTNTFNFYSIMTAIGILASLFFLFLPPVNNTKSEP